MQQDGISPSDHDLLVRIDEQLRWMRVSQEERDRTTAVWRSGIDKKVEANRQAITDIREDRIARWSRLSVYVSIAGAIAGLLAATVVALVRAYFGF